MGSQLPPPAAKPPSIPSAATATRAAAADGTTPTTPPRPAPRDLPPLAQPAGARPRRLFRALHPAPLLGLFLEVDEDADVSRVRAAVFSSETWDWAIHPWVEIGGGNSLKYNAGMLVDGFVYWPFHGEHRMIRINTATMEVTNVDLPLQVDVESCNYKAGETRDGQLCIVYAADDFHLHVWIRGVDGDGIGIWVPHNILS